MYQAIGFLDDAKLSPGQAMVPSAKHQLLSEKPRLKTLTWVITWFSSWETLICSLRTDIRAAPLLSSRLSPSWAQDSEGLDTVHGTIPTCYPWCRALFVGGHSLSEVPWAGPEDPNMVLSLTCLNMEGTWWVVMMGWAGQTTMLIRVWKDICVEVSRGNIGTTPHSCDSASYTARFVALPRVIVPFG